MTSRAPYCTALLTVAIPLVCARAALADSPGAEAPTDASAQVEEPQHLFAAPTRADRIGRIMAPVIINGRGPFRLIVDTGANQSVLTHTVADMLGLTPSPDGNVRLTGVTGTSVVPTIKIDSLETGDLRQHDLRLAVMRTVSGGAEGILGMQGFDGKRIKVDFVNDRIEISDSRGQRAGRDFIALPAKIRFGRLLMVDGRVGGIKVHAVIDTGAERTLGNAVLRDQLLRRKRLPAPPTSAGVIGLTEDEQRGDAIWTRKISLGEMTITDVDVIYGDIHVFKVWELENEPAILVGMDVLGMLHTLIVDYRLKQVQIRIRNEDAPRRPLIPSQT